LSAVASADGATNTMPWFNAGNGPILEARFVQTNGAPDGGVHNLFVVTGRADAGSCNITQPDFLPAGNPLTGQGGNGNIVFRIPTPVFSSKPFPTPPFSATRRRMRPPRAKWACTATPTPSWAAP
jgi:hypothetical protein